MLICIASPVKHMQKDDITIVLSVAIFFSQVAYCLSDNILKNNIQFIQHADVLPTVSSG